MCGVWNEYTIGSHWFVFSVYIKKSRMGQYALTGSSEGGRPVYTQQNGANYLYFQVTFYSDFDSLSNKDLQP